MYRENVGSRSHNQHSGISLSSLYIYIIYYKPLKQTFFCKASDNNVWFFLTKKLPLHPNINEI